jgi:rhodanese-related sulfurtransferase
MVSLIDRESIQSKLEAGESITLVEALPQRYFDREHLPGAINIPHDEIKEKSSLLPPDKSALIVVYCSNTACKNSGIAANELIKQGYQNVFKYAEGKQDWIEANLPIERSA